MRTFPRPTRESVLFITLDSLRFDTLVAADAPNMKSVAPLHQAQAPSYYTYGSHSAMFVGFTPGIADAAEPIVNPKFGKLFKLVGAGFPGKGREAYELQGRNIIEGFKHRGFVTIGTGAVGWFNPNVPTGRHLTKDFNHYFYPGDSHSLPRQLDWIAKQLESVANSSLSTDVFVFLNVGETHVPYYYHGAAWSASDNPCVPFQQNDRSQECRLRQRACCEFVDRELQPLLTVFSGSTILICSDHGDCWGEDGLWEHGISHSATLTVPLIVRAFGTPVGSSARISRLSSPAVE